MHYYIQVLKKYAVFGGRARRKEYWNFILFNALFSLIIVIIEFSTGMRSMAEGSSTKFGVLSGIYALLTLLPVLSVMVRRLHDTSRSGWWLLIGLIPLIGGIVLFVFSLLDSTPGTNEYGPNPKGVEAAGTPAATPVSSAPVSAATSAPAAPAAPAQNPVTPPGPTTTA